MKKIVLLAVLVICTMAMTIAFFGYRQIPSSTTKESNNINIRADSYITIKDVNGNVKYYFEHPALFTTVGKDFVKVCLGVNASCGLPTAFDFIAVGGNTSALAAGDTTLANEVAANGLNRAFGTYASTGTGAWRIEKDFSVSGTQNHINSTGILNASSSGSLFAEDTFADTNTASGDTLNITWTVSVS